MYAASKSISCLVVQIYRMKTSAVIINCMYVCIYLKTTFPMMRRCSPSVWLDYCGKLRLDKITTVIFQRWDEFQIQLSATSISDSFCDHIPDQIMLNLKYHQAEILDGDVSQCNQIESTWSMFNEDWIVKWPVCHCCVNLSVYLIVSDLIIIRWRISGRD